MWDLDRRREKLKGLASRLEQIASGNAKERVRSLRRLSVSAFSSGRIIDGLVREIEILERENGIELSKESRNPSLEGALEASGVRRLIDPSLEISYEELQERVELYESSPKDSLDSCAHNI